MAHMLNISEGKLKPTNRDMLISKDKVDSEFTVRNSNPEKILAENESIALIDESFIRGIHEVVMLGTGYVIKSNHKVVRPNKEEQETNFKRIQNNQQPLTICEHTVKFHKSHSSKKFTQLDDYAYSLGAVYRFIDPARHFFRGYTNLTEIDFATLEKEYIYTERTIFGQLLNALPRENKLEFRLIAMAQFQTHQLHKIPYSDGLKLLNKYIDNSIIQPGKYIVESMQILKESFLNIIPDIKSIGFFDEEQLEKEENQKKDKTEDELKKEPKISYDNILSIQSEYFNETFKLQKDLVDLFSQKVNLKDTKEIAIHFDLVFKDKYWPIDLN